MGWESISMGLNAQGEVLNNSYWTSAPEDGAMLWPQFAEGNISGSMTLYASELQYGDSTNGLVYDDNGHILYVYYNGQQVAYFGLHAYDEWISYLIFFGINEENQVGSIWIAERRMTDRWGYTIAGGRVLAGTTTQIYNTNLAYNIIKRIMPSNWKNVDWELMDPIKLPSIMRDDYIINYNYDTPIQSGQTWEGFKSYVIPGTMIPVTFGPFVTINFKYGSLIYGADGYGYIAIRDNDGNVISEIRGLLFWLSTTELYLIAGVDEKNKEGRIGLYLRPQSGYGSSVNFNLKSKNKQAYEFITQNLLGATVNVNYYIPEGTYQYAKITYKQNTSPIDQNDGDSVDIDPTLSSVNIKGLEEEKTYWFVIFTDKSESEAFEYTIEVDPVPPEYKTYIDNINGTGFDWIRELEQDTATITNSDRSTFTADMYKYYPMNKVTWYTYSHQGTDIEYWNKSTFEGQTTALFVSSKIDKVEINSNNNVYSCTITKNNENSVTSPDRMFVYEKNVTMGGIYTKDTLPRGWYANFNYHSGYLAYGPNCNPFYLAGSWSTRTFSGTLKEVFEQLQKYVRNIDIYVDGVLWSKAGK